MSGKARILIVEDTPSQAELLRALLAGEGHDLRIKDSAGGAFDLVRTWDPDVILLDLELPDYSGFELMRQLRAASINTAVIVITANASVNTAVEAMREGAVDFLMKPFNRARLTVTLGNCLEKRALAAELQSIKGQLGRDRFFGFIGASAAMQAVYRTIEAVATSKASVFVTGESGTGKELAADAVHRAIPRRAKPFIALNCGAIPRDLLESEIFGHVKGAFTGATDNRVGAAKAADGGTLFLDEIGEMPLDMQVKLLRFVQTGTFTAVGGSRTEKVDIRFVCATNRDPMLEVQEGRFREDLFYRLYVVPIELPPLRERGDDVLLIARQFLVDFAKEEGRRFQRFAPDVEWLMLSYRWPGNVRQLQNAVRNIVVLHDAEVVEVSMLPPALMVGASPEQLRQAAQAAVSAAPPRAPAATPILPAAPSPGPSAALPPEAPAIPDTVSIMGQADMAPRADPGEAYRAAACDDASTNADPAGPFSHRAPGRVGLGRAGSGRARSGRANPGRANPGRTSRGRTSRGNGPHTANRDRDHPARRNGKAADPGGPGPDRERRPPGRRAVADQSLDDLSQIARLAGRRANPPDLTTTRAAEALISAVRVAIRETAARLPWHAMCCVSRTDHRSSDHRSSGHRETALHVWNYRHRRDTSRCIGSDRGPRAA